MIQFKFYLIAIFNILLSYYSLIFLKYFCYFLLLFSVIEKELSCYLIISN